LLAFAAWTLALLAFGVGPIRLTAIARGELRASQVRSEVPQLGERFQRLHRAHLNCVENLPVFASVVLTAHVLGYQSTSMNVLALLVVGMRVVQSTAHIASGRGHAITVRFTAFVAQFVSMAAMLALTALYAGR
jgi:uncharacterized MAPEG superfamily protein